MTDWRRLIQAPLKFHRHDRPLYFLHIPKTAGTSMRSILMEAFGDRLCPATMWDDFFREPGLRCGVYDAYSGHFGMILPAFLGTRMRIFTILREPVSRTVSHFHEVRRTVSHPMHYLVSKQTLRDFVFDPATVPMLLNFQARYLAATGIILGDLADNFLPYWGAQYTLSVAWENATSNIEASRLKKAALATLHSLDFIALTEDFDADLVCLRQMFGLPDVGSPRLNASPREDAMQPIEPDVEQRIRHLTLIDAALYAAAKSIRLQQEHRAGRLSTRGL
jgi:hypothetical protein